MEEERIFIETPKLSELFMHRKTSSEENGSFINSQRNPSFNNESRNVLIFGGISKITNNSAEK